MSLLSAEDQSKLQALAAILAAARRGERDQTDVVELLRVDWGAPDGTVYYASTFADDIFPALRARLGSDRVEPRLTAGQFLDVTIESGVSDDALALDFWEPDGEISALFATHGEGQRVEVFYYFPEVDLLLSVWFGHLRPPEDADEERFTCRAENGFMSVLLPLPRRAFFNTCQAVFGRLLGSQSEIDEHACPWNLHLPGGTVGVAGSELLPPCPRRTREDCRTYLGDDLSFFAFDSAAASYPVGSKGVIATSRGNETNLKRPLRVIAGEWIVRDLDLLKSVVETGNPAHPERGSIKLLYGVAEGELDAMFAPNMSNVAVNPQHYATRPGAMRQPSTNFLPNVSNYSGTSLLNVVLQGDFRNTPPSQISSEIRVRGDKRVRVYASDDPTDFVEQYSTDRAWWLLHALRNKLWGLGADVRRFAIEKDFRPLSAWYADNVSFKASDGTTYTGPRSQFNAELIDRTAQQQITDICQAGRCTVPFPFEGRLRVFPLKKLTDQELADAPVFTDYDSGFERNIIREGDRGEGKSTLRRSSVSDAILPNRLVGTFYNRAANYEEQPLTEEPPEAIEQQLRAGRAFGDTGRRVVEKTYGFFGVTDAGEASRLKALYLALGEFDDGGLFNNERVTFQTFFSHAIGLYKSKVVRVLSRSLVNKRTGLQRFEFYRVRLVRREPNLLATVSLQAYPVDYYDLTEDIVIPVGDGGGGLVLPNPGGGHGLRPRPVLLADLEHTNDRLHFRLALD